MTIRIGKHIIAGNGAAGLATVNIPGIVKPDGTSIIVSEDATISVNSDQINLSNYYTKEEIDNQLGDINTILDSIIGEEI